MRRRQTARFISIAALLPLLALAVSGVGYSRFRCAFTGAVSDVSEPGCCPAEAPPAVPTLSSSSCCDHESGQVVRPPAETAGPEASCAPAPALLASTAVVPPSGGTGIARFFRVEILRHPRLPLLLLKRSFLI
jgi:hypothetical protein